VLRVPRFVSFAIFDEARSNLVTFPPPPHGLEQAVMEALD